jgi:hypothetical protein
MSDTQATTRHCYRCGKEKLEQLRLLPGSTHITLCPDCYAIIWGWHEQPSKPALRTEPGEDVSEAAP